MNETVPINFDPLRRALQSLSDALTPPPRNDRERDGAIQRFEYTFELAWKVTKRALAVQGIESTSPKTVIRDAAAQRWIGDPEAWFQFLRARNYTSHLYNEQVAQFVFEKAKQFAGECRSLLTVLERQ